MVTQLVHQHPFQRREEIGFYIIDGIEFLSPVPELEEQLSHAIFNQFVIGGDLQTPAYQMKISIVVQREKGLFVPFSHTLPIKPILFFIRHSVPVYRKSPSKTWIAVSNCWSLPPLTFSNSFPTRMSGSVSLFSRKLF